MISRGISRKLRCLPFLAAIAWVTNCSSPVREFGPGNAGADGSSAGGPAAGASGHSSVAGHTSSNGGRSTSSGGAPATGDAGTGDPSGGGNSAGTGAAVAGAAGSGSSPAGSGGGPAGAGAGGGPGGAAGSSTAGQTNVSDGFACSANAECSNGHCADGVCCHTDCTGCNACSNALTGQNNGTCAPVTSGQDPHATCADETATKQCGNDGTCDGKGACAKVSASHVCTAAGCSADGKSFLAVSTCNRDGSGTCASVSAQDCAGFPCLATGCAKPCTTNTDCSSTNYCDTGTGKCVARKADGSMAANTYECTSGIIADGVCCNSACTGKCQSCKQTPGVCKAVTTPRSSCGGSGTCGTMKCDGTHADCVSPGNEVTCSTSCSSDLTAKVTATCDGSGACGAGQSAACSSSQYCSNSQCVAKSSNGTGGCSKSVTCSSGNCASSSSGGTMCCAANAANCSQGCFDLSSSLAHCGTCSNSCDPNENCTSGACKCAHGTIFSCQTCPSWSFESNTTEGWLSNPDAGLSVTPRVANTPSGATFSGSHSLAISANKISQLVDENGAHTVGLRIPFCAATQTVSGLSFFLYLDGPAYSVSKYEYAHVIGPEDSDGINFLDLPSGLPSKKWLYISQPMANPQVTELDIIFAPNNEWTGTIYIDEVQMQR